MFSNIQIDHVKKSLDFCVFPENSIRTGGSNFTVKHLVELKGIFSIMWVCTAEFCDVLWVVSTYQHMLEML